MYKRILTKVLSIILVISLLGCDKVSENMTTRLTTSSITTQSGKNGSNNPVENNQEESSRTTGEEISVTEDNVKNDDTQDIIVEGEISEEQRRQNSFSMLYHLAIVAEEIRTSKDNRLILEDIYTSLLNDINPEMVDEKTQDHLKNLRDIIKSYLSISIKRERLQFIYNQKKAAAIRSAVPNPLSILSTTRALDWKRLAINVVYTAVDAYTSYKTASENADNEFLMSGWELDDEEIATIQKNRDRAFDYMVDMVQEYHFNGKKTLNEKAIENFTEICSLESVNERLKRLEINEDTYSLLGNYWLELADCYYETEDYTKCLECVNKYKELSTGILRQDYDYAAILPKAIVAAQHEFSGSEYDTIARKYANDILKNTTYSDDDKKANWSIRYFVAQVYIDLYSKTKNIEDLQKSFDILYETIVLLLPEQRALNETYLNPVEEVKIEEPDYKYLTEKEEEEKKKEYKVDKNRLEQYNKDLKKKRETELPSLYEPLIINCETLFAIADKLPDYCTKTKKDEIENILQTSNNGIFMVKPINDAYSFSRQNEVYNIDLKEDEIVIPVSLLTQESTITVTVTEKDKSTVFDDCIVSKVKRKGEDINTFKAYISSKRMKKYKWTPDSKILIEIKYGDAYDRSLQFKFIVGKYKKNLLGTKVEFKKE